MKTPDPASETVLILAPLGRDAELAAAALAEAGFKPVVCRDLPDLIGKLSAPCGAALIAEESLRSPDFAGLTHFLKQQPAWSDLPFIILTSGRIATDMSRNMLNLFSPQGNITLLERPIRVITLCSMLEVALRARRRQYEVRDLMVEREEVLSSERAARSEAERAGRMKDEFLATLSHELRTPLNAILGWSSLLRADLKDVEGLEQGLETIERNARSQSKIIDDLLDMSRIISGKIHLDLHSFDLGALLGEAMSAVQPAAAAREIEMGIELDPQVGEIVGDPLRLQQVFYNLLSNAIKFTPVGGKIGVFLQRLPASMEIAISDTGLGIEPEFLPFVFDRFRQADASSTRRHGGLGLGLAIVKQLVELHGGDIRVESAGVGKGSRFTVSLPIGLPLSQATRHSMPQPDFSEKTETPKWQVCKRLHGIHILIVDDEPDALSMMKRLFEECQAIVRTAGSATEAFSALQKEPPDILVSDIGMPGENGYALIRRIRALRPESGGVVPAVALTAYARAEDRSQALLAGFQKHLTKPLEASLLIDTIAHLVHNPKNSYLS